MTIEVLSDRRAASGSPVDRPDVCLRRRRWATLLLVWLAFLISFVDRLIWANVASSVGVSLGLQLAALNVFVTAFYTGYVLSNFGSGFLTDRLGGRLMLLLALVPLGAFTFLFGFTNSIPYGLVLQALMGVAAGADYAAGVKLITAWFGRRDRGRAMGLYLTAPTVGVAVTNALVPALIDAFDWSTIYQFFGVVTVGIGVLCFFTLKNEPPTGPNTAPEQRPAAAPVNPLILLRNRNLIFLALAGFGGIWGSFGFIFWVNALLIRGHGMTPVDAGGIAALFGLGALIGSPLVGLLSDKLGRRKLPIIASLVAFIVLLLLFGGIHTPILFWIAAPLLGAAAFVYQPLLGAMIAECAGLALAGTATGVTNACWQLGTILVPLVVGVVFQMTGAFSAAFITLALGPLFAMAAMVLVRESSHPAT